MGLIERIVEPIVQRILAQKAAPSPPAPFLLDDAASWAYRLPSLDTAAAQASLMGRLAWVQIAVTVVAQQAAAVPLRVVRMEDEDAEQIVNHPFELLLQRPNPLMSRFELIEATIAHRALTGNAYWYLNAPAPSSPPAEIWVLPPHLVEPIPDGRSYIAGYLYRSGSGQEFRLPPESVVHFKRYHPLNPLLGLSPIESAAMDISTELAQAEWQRNFFGEQNAKVPGMLAFADPIPDGQWAKLKSDLIEQFGGTRRSGLMMMRGVGSGGVNYVPMALSQRDMALLESRQFTKEEIFNLFAPGLSSILAINATEANSRTGKATLIEFAVSPALMAVAEKITVAVLPRYGANLRAEFDDIRETDRLLELEEIDRAMRVMTVGELRGRYYQLAPLGDERDALLASQAASAPAPLPPQAYPAATRSDAPSPAAANKTAAPPSAPAPAPDQPAGVAPHGSASGDALMDELATWRRWAQRRVKTGRPLRVFESDIIPPALAGAIDGQLAGCQTPDEVALVFDVAIAAAGGQYA